MSETVTVPKEYVELVDAIVEALPEFAELTPAAVEMIADATRKTLDDMLEETK